MKIISQNEMTKKLKEGKVFLISHNDMDGYGCGKIINSFITTADAVYIPLNKINEEIKNYCNFGHNQYDVLIICDLNLNMNNLQDINNLAKEGHTVMYFDHHIKNTYQTEFLNESNILFDYDINFSATQIVLNYFVNNNFTTNVNLERLTNIVKMIDDWDLFKWQDPNTFEVINNSARDLAIFFKEFGAEKFVQKFDDHVSGRYEKLFSVSEISVINYIKRSIYKEIRDKYKTLIRIKYPTNERTYNIGIIYADKNISELGNGINIMDNSIDFVVIADLNHNSVNFRTIKNDINLAAIASNFGGGGHYKASGCELTDEAFNIFVCLNINKDEQNENDSSTVTENETVE